MLTKTLLSTKVS